MKGGGKPSQDIGFTFIPSLQQLTARPPPGGSEMVKLPVIGTLSSLKPITCDGKILDLHETGVSIVSIYVRFMAWINGTLQIL